MDYWPPSHDQTPTRSLGFVLLSACGQRFLAEERVRSAVRMRPRLNTHGVALFTRFVLCKTVTSIFPRVSHTVAKLVKVRLYEFRSPNL